MMLPDDVSVPAIDGGTPNGQPPLQAHGVLSALQLGLDAGQGAESYLEDGRGSSSELAPLQVNKKDTNNALKTLARICDVDAANKMLSCMVKANIPLQHSTLVDVMIMLNHVKDYEGCIDMFNKLESYGMPHPTPPAWGALIEAKCEGGIGNVDEGLKIIKHLEKSGVVLLASMFNPVLRGLIKNGRHDETFDTWVSMKVKGVNPNVQSYNIMIEQCEHRGQPERAFFLVDEMKLHDLIPVKDTYCKLIRACGTAPMWVNGYQDIIFDAIAKVEGQELMPDLNLYNSVIYAFSKVGDGVAAEFYLQEMKRKNISPNTTSYNHVFTAYANNQLVGAKTYGKLGRYVRPAPPPDTERQALYKEAGFDVVNEELSKTFIKPDAPTRGKRQKTQYEDLYEFDDEAQEDFEANLRLEVEAKKMRLQRDQAEWEEKVKQLNAGREPGGAARLNSASAPGLKGKAKGLAALPGRGGGGVAAKEEEEVEEDDHTSAYSKRLAGGDAGLQDLFKEMSGGIEGPGSESYEKMMAQMNSGEDLDPSAFLSEEDKKDWAKFLGGMDNVDGDGAEKFLNIDDDEDGEDEAESAPRAGGGKGQIIDAESGDSGIDVEDSDDLLDDDMMKKISGMLATMDGGDGEGETEKVSFVTGSAPETQHSTSDAFRTLNTLLGHLDGGQSAGVTMKDHYVTQNKSITGGELELDEDGLVSSQEVDRLWDLVEFGRAPKPDYSETLRHRRSLNIARSMELYEEMCYRENLKPNEKTLASLVGVVGYATLHRKANELVEMFAADHNVSPNRFVFDSMIKMHLIRNDIDSAMEAKTNMIEYGFVPSRESYGLMIQSLAARKMLEESLLVLEDAADRQVKIRDTFLKNLRFQCTKLGVIHPDIPPDPMEWVNQVRLTRTKNKNRSKANVQPVQSGFYNS
jgi:pentatricopeptide repeat protein